MVEELQCCCVYFVVVHEFDVGVCVVYVERDRVCGFECFGCYHVGDWVGVDGLRGGAHCVVDVFELVVGFYQ